MALRLSAIGRPAAYSVTFAAASIVAREIMVCPSGDGASRQMRADDAGTKAPILADR
jgi:hypothetical protein